MKKRLFFILLIISSLSVFTGCTDSESEDVTEEHHASFSIPIEDPSAGYSHSGGGGFR